MADLPTFEHVLENRRKLIAFWMDNRQEGEYGIGAIIQSDGGLWLSVRCEHCDRPKRTITISADGETIRVDE